MESVSLQNGIISARIALLGAELLELNNSANDTILWKKDDAIWNRTAPNLFPIVGRLLNDSYTWKGEAHTMRQHGFARDQEFEVTQQSATSVCLLLKANASTRFQFPFEFEFEITYTLEGNNIQISHCTRNLTAEKMPYSVGGHPGFALKEPLNQYELLFSNAFQAERCIIEGNYYSGATKTMNIAPVLPLDFSLFASDALVYKQPPFQSVTLSHATKGKLVTLHFDSLDAIGFWTKEHAPFFCIEPWWGWADAHSHNGNLTEKEGMHWLNAGEEETLVYWLEVF
jgi:galactose mutarotase-like enzyme